MKVCKRSRISFAAGAAGAAAVASLAAGGNVAKATVGVFHGYEAPGDVVNHNTWNQGEAGDAYSYTYSYPAGGTFHFLYSTGITDSIARHTNGTNSVPGISGTHYGVMHPGAGGGARSSHLVSSPARALWSGPAMRSPLPTGGGLTPHSAPISCSVRRGSC